MTTPTGLQITDTKVGTGATPKTGQTCVMHYTGWLYQNGAKGQKFDSSVDRGQPFEFPIGTRRVITGWDEGVATMKVGGKRTLIIPPAARLRRARRRRRDPAERHADLRGRAARREGLAPTRNQLRAMISRSRCTSRRDPAHAGAAAREETRAAPGERRTAAAALRRRLAEHGAEPRERLAELAIAARDQRRHAEHARPQLPFGHDVVGILGRIELDRERGIDDARDRPRRRPLCRRSRASAGSRRRGRPGPAC